MRLVIQRVSEARVTVGSEIVGEIGAGLMVLLGIEEVDDASDVDWLVTKLVKMRLFSDAEGKMNASLQDVAGQLLVISQFTLHASTKKGNRPSFIRAARPEHAVPLYEMFIEKAAIASGRPVASGRFGTEMHVQLVNDGPVTITLDSRKRE